MKKIFSLFAAVLMAGSMMADVADMYIKHNWAGAGNWTWKQMTYDAETETYLLREIYGATGCNWNTSASDNGSTWVASPTLVGNPLAGDSAVFALKNGEITITKIGEAREEPTTRFLKHNWAGAGSWTWKEMAREGETSTYTLRDIYGGTGCNWNVVGDDAGATWVATPTLVGEPAVGDSAVFSLVEGAITITKIESEGPGPEPKPETLDTLYLVNSKGWGGPKIHLWGGTATGTTWPGVAMVKVNGVQADGFDVYMYSYNHGDYAKCIFNNGGSVKSGDLVIAGNEGKYFNFADQTWYESAEAVVCTWYLNANYNGTTEWRELTRGEGTFTRRDVYAPATNYYYNGMADDNLKSEIKGGNLTIDSNLAAGDSAVFTLDPYAKTINITKITGSNPPAPTINYYLAGSMNTPEWGSVAMPGDSIVLDLEAGEYGFKVQTGAGVWDGALTYDNVNAECSSEGLYTNGDRNVMFTLAEAGQVKIKVVEGAICVTGAFQVQETYNYYLAGTMNSWGSTGMAGDSIVLDLEAGEHQFKIQLVAGFWDTALGISAVNAECSSEGYYGNNDGNVCFTLTEAGQVKIKVVGGAICLTLPASTPTDINNIEAGKVVKMIENGQVVIIRDGIRYNAVGAKL